MASYKYCGEVSGPRLCCLLFPQGFENRATTPMTSIHLATREEKAGDGDSARVISGRFVQVAPEAQRAEPI